MDKKALEAVDAIGKKIGDAISQQVAVMDMSGEFDHKEILACFNVAICLSACSAILTFAKHFPNYKTRDKYLDEFKRMITETIDKGKDLKETDLARH